MGCRCYRRRVSRDVLEDLRVADREALAAEGTLEHVFADAVAWLSSVGRRPRKGEVRSGDIDEATQALELAMARADGALARIERSVPPRDALPPAGLGYRWPFAARTADRAHVGQLRIRRDREWLRARFDELAAELEPKPEPLSVLEPFDDETQRRERALAKAVGRVRAHLLFVVLFSAVIVIYAVCGPV